MTPSRTLLEPVASEIARALDEEDGDSLSRSLQVLHDSIDLGRVRIEHPVGTEDFLLDELGKVVSLISDDSACEGSG